MKNEKGLSEENRAALLKIRKHFNLGENVSDAEVAEKALSVDLLSLHELGLAKRTLAKIKARLAGFNNFVPSSCYL